MKIQVLSDLHIEFEEFEYPSTDADVVVLAGDIHLGIEGVQWAKHAIPKKPIIYVLGNHEYYKNAYPKLLGKLEEEVKGSNVHLLENRQVTLDGVVFLGCSLWTDFRLFGDPKVAGYEANHQMNDYQHIKKSPQYSKLRSIDTAGIHHISLKWMRQEFMKHKGNDLVIVTHHAPSVQSVPPQFAGNILSAAFASDLEEDIQNSEAKLWIHGHVHTPVDYRVGRTRVLCNPRGYPHEPNPTFNPTLVVEI